MLSLNGSQNTQEKRNTQKNILAHSALFDFKRKFELKRNTEFLGEAQTEFRGIDATFSMGYS